MTLTLGLHGGVMDSANYLTTKVNENPSRGKGDMERTAKSYYL